MEKINARKIAFTYAGSFLGAGYVSGQELWQFFGEFGARGLVGFVLSLMMITALGLAIMRIVTEAGVTEVDRVLVPWKRGAFPRSIAATLQSVMLFGVLAVMLAGSGALLHQLFGLPTVLGSLIACVIAIYIALKGFGGIVRFFSLLVPVMVVLTLCFAAVSIASHGFPVPEATGGDNPLVRNWVIGSFTYAFFNVFVSVAVIAPLGVRAESSKAARLGAWYAAAILLVIAMSVLCALNTYPEAAETALPMLTLAYSINKPMGFVYGVLLLLSMFGCILSVIVVIAEFICEKWTAAAKRNKTVVIALGAAGLAASLVGFGELISVLYPLFGYIGSVFMVSMAVYAVKLIINKRKAETK